jgi:hypothetical protein
VVGRAPAEADRWLVVEETAGRLVAGSASTPTPGVATAPPSGVAALGA